MDDHIYKVISNILVLSTRHLSPDALALIEDSDLGMPVAVIPTPIGTFINVQDFNNLTDDYGEIPLSIEDVIDFALDQGINWIKFDPNGSVVDDLITYGHKERHP